MAYSTPKLQRIGTAQNLVLGDLRFKTPGRDNCETIGVDQYDENPLFLDESEW